MKRPAKRPQSFVFYGNMTLFRRLLVSAVFLVSVMETTQATFEMDLYFRHNCVINNPGVPLMQGELDTCYNIIDNIIGPIASYIVKCYENGTYQPFMNFIQTDCVNLLPMTYYGEKDGKACWWLEDDLLVSRTNFSFTLTDPGCVAWGETSPLPTPFVPENLTRDSDMPCFPANAQVWVSSLSRVEEMINLRVGDVVRSVRVVKDVAETSMMEMNPTLEQTDSPIYVFTHQVFHQKAHFLNLITEDNSSLTISPNHYLYTGAGNLKVARDIQPLRDTLLYHDGRSLQVVKITEQILEGYFSPHTHDESMVVDGFVVSCYTNLVPISIAKIGLAPFKLLSYLGLSRHSFYLKPFLSILDMIASVKKFKII